jgi:hypothetical protein
VRIASGLFLLALVLRVLFWVSTPDWHFAWSVGFQGDAPLWQQLAHDKATATPNELWRLPLRPPAMQWCIAWLWDGDDSAVWLRGLFVVLGALLAPVFFLYLRRHIPQRQAVLAALLCAASSNLMLLSSGLHSELPYLLLFFTSLFDHDRLRSSPDPAAAVRWGLAHAALCLLRVEHLLVAALLLLHLVHSRKGNSRRMLGLAAASLVLGLLPWQLKAMRMVEEYNAAGPPSLPAPETAAPGNLPWSEQALRRLATMPAFQQGPTFAFVQDTVRIRGGTRVDAADLDILQQAYGCWPEPLPTPLLCSYGGLNFFLANSAEAAGGFSNAALDRPPQLLGGPGRYPPGLSQVLPRGGRLALSYPPHLDLLDRGYRHGVAEIQAAPLDAAMRIGCKLAHMAEGMSGGIGGYALPIGLSGDRRPVDFVTATGAWAWTWRVAMLGMSLVALRRILSKEWIMPLLLFALARLAIVTTFFGYARQGALCWPIVALGLAVALDRAVFARLTTRGQRRTLLLLAATLVCLETLRALTTTATIDGGLLASRTTSPIDHESHRITFR